MISHLILQKLPVIVNQVQRSAQVNEEGNDVECGNEPYIECEIDLKLIGVFRFTLNTISIKMGKVCSDPSG